MMTTTLQDLKALPQWVGWKSIWREGAKKPTKVPMDAHTGGAASSIDPKTWTTAGEAWEAKRRYGWHGIGFVFTLKTGIVGIDLDDCFEQDDQGHRHLKPWAREIVQMFDTYQELSPSGEGVHLLVKGTIPYAINKSKAHGVEVYAEARYFTVTGKPYGGEARPIAHLQPQLDALMAVYGHDDEPLPKVATRTRYRNDEVDRRELERALTYIPPQGEYVDWLRVLMGIHDAFPDSTGVAIAEAWSPGYRGEIANKFRSFRRDDGVTVATVFHMAKENGYTPPGPPTQTRLPKVRTSHYDRMRALAAA